MTKPNQPLHGKAVCITGTLSVTRDHFALLIEYAGGVAVSSLSKTTDILIVGADPGDAKIDKARENGTAIWDEHKARRVMAGEDKGLYTVKVYGASDDLVEIEGHVTDELDGGDEPTYVRFTNGTYIAIRHGDEGIWRARVIDQGRGKVRKLYGIPEGDAEDGPTHQAHGDSDAPVYSDVLIIESEEALELESWGRKPLPPARAGLAKAKAIVEVLDGRKGLDHWWHDIDQDDKTEILEAIAAVVEGKG